MIYDSSSISQSLPVPAHQHRPSFLFFWVFVHGVQCSRETRVLILNDIARACEPFLLSIATLVTTII